MWWKWWGKRRFDPVESFTTYLKGQRPHWRVLGVSEGMLEIEIADDTLSLSAHRIAELAGREGESSPQCRAAFAQLLALLEQAVGGAPDLSREADGARLRPRLLPEDYFDELRSRARDDDAPVARALPELGLWIAYVLDSEHSVQFLMRSQLAKLEMDEDELHSTALANLADERFRQVVRSVIEARQAVNFKCLDSYDASRLLLVPQYLNDGEAVAACIPDRDTLFLCPEPAADQWPALVEVARAPVSDRLILDRPVRVTRDGLERK